MTTDRPETGGEPGGPFQERREARGAALQMLYQCEVGQVPPEEALDAYRHLPPEDRAKGPGALEFAARLVIGTTRSLEEIDPVIEAHSEHWRAARMNVVDRQILRMAVYQFLHVRDVPPVVVIDESVELARTFGGDESSRFVNGLLDAIRKQLDLRPETSDPESIS